MITLGYPKYPGEPTAPFIDSAARGLASRGHSIDVVLPYHPDFRYPDSDSIRFFPYRYTPFRGFAPWGFGNSYGAKSRISATTTAVLPLVALSLRRAIGLRLGSQSYDVVHAHWVMPNGWLAAAPARSHNTPLVVSLWGSDVAMAERHELLGRLARRAFKSATSVTATSDDLLERARALGADPRRSETIRLGVDTDRFVPGPPDTALRRRLGADDGTFLVVSVGRLAEVKGFEYLIDAAAQLRGTTVAIIGDGELRQQLERRVAATAAPVRLAGSMDRGEVAAAIASADVLVVPSVVDRSGRVDGLPSTVLEAMSSGRPLVATRVGGIPEIVTDGANGLLVPEKDPEALAAAVRRLQDDPALRTRISQQAREFALENLSWAKTAAAFERVYEQSVIPARGTRADDAT